MLLSSCFFQLTVCYVVSHQIDPMSPEGFDTRNAEKSLASAILTGAFKNTEEAGSDYTTPSAGSFKGKSNR